MELAQEKTGLLIGKKIGAEIEGEMFGLPGYILKLTGGSDDSGFPMRPEIEGSGKFKILLSKGVGYKQKKKGDRRRKTIRRNTVDQSIVQVNTKVIKQGQAPLTELVPKKEKTK
jgi:small subunit ribosomal protein S6e